MPVALSAAVGKGSHYRPPGVEAYEVEFARLRRDQIHELLGGGELPRFFTLGGVDGRGQQQVGVFGKDRDILEQFRSRRDQRRSVHFGLPGERYTHLRTPRPGDHREGGHRLQHAGGLPHARMVEPEEGGIFGREREAHAVGLAGATNRVGQSEEVGAIDEAATALKRGLEKSVDQPDLLLRLSELYLMAKRYADCDQVLRRRLSLATLAESKIALGLQLTQVNSDLDRPREAASALSEAIKAGASEADHLPRLGQLLEQGGQLRELVEVQSQLIAIYELAGDKEKAQSLSMRRARLLETALGDKPEAIRRYAEVLARQPSDADALAALENLLIELTHREAAARALLPAYEVAKDHRKQVAVLALIAETAKDSLERLTVLKRAAEIHTVHLRQPERAFASLATAMRLASDDAEIRAGARAAADDADALDSYAEVLEELLERGVESVAITLHRELADVYEKKLNKQDDAVKHLRAVLLVDPKHLEALRSLQRLYRTREEYQELVPVIERLAVMEADLAARSSLDREAAVLSEQKLNDPR